MRYLLLTGAYAIACLFSPFPAIAQYDDEIDCEKTQTDLEIVICAGRSEQQSYQAMQAAYQKVQQQYQSQNYQSQNYQSQNHQSQNDLAEGYREKRLNSLIASQKAWFEYRQAHCKWIASKLGGGSMQPTAEVTCQAELNQQRMAELLQDLED
ncbi:lysozyme inhibitor LprI family protein [Alkalinema sp. FACHB-956]|uniref:lysozyme inhibitor LprI family protein n=1 Tax=Alkalinema sp. FACHB-956 TaxID=2692768 RepID=UPI001689B805|nr:lysozyme inhibitor LprI family protein [Alkalinema sp. FACHB-956]MBD2326107.1 DUF1311 domain-containing protein [Alkalinema sp. FACHB-956]